MEEAHLNARITRRTCNAALAFALPAIALNRSVLAQPAQSSTTDEREWRHGLSLYGDLKYKPGFKHFDYVNPSAPKGGAVHGASAGKSSSSRYIP